METNLNKKQKQKDSHSYNKRLKTFQTNYNLTKEEAISAITLLDEYLPYGYTQGIVLMASKNKMNVTKQVVRLVKFGKTKNTILFNYLIKFASENKANEMTVRRKIKDGLAN